MYNFLRNNGFSTTDIVTIIQGHDKTHLIGANTSDQNTNFTVTLHHDWFINPWDRLPRLRAGNVHNYNIYVDDTGALAARRLRDARAAAMSSSARNTLDNTYSFRPFLNGSISTEGGAVLVENSVYVDCLTPLRNNQTDPSDSFYTGKIKALNTIYQFDDTTVRGDSTDPGNPLGPLQAAVIPFSWNLPGNQLPYSYTMDDPDELPSILSQGAGARAVNWDKTNWLMTAYAPTAPVLVAEPKNQSVQPGGNAIFAVVAGGSTPLHYQWYFNTNSAISGATNAILSLSNVQSINLGAYSVIVSNSVDAVASDFAMLTFQTGFEAWQSINFTAMQLEDPAFSGPNATPAGDGVANLVKYALGLPPLIPAQQPLVGISYNAGEAVLTYHRPATISDVIYQAETCTDLLTWSSSGMIQQIIGTDSDGRQIWQASYSGASDPKRFLRLVLVH
jgi:hypothetical protein